MPSIYVISAMCGNFWGESSINPAIYESLYKFDGWEYTWKKVGNKGTGGYGLGQWTNTGGDSHGRLYKLNQYLTGRGLSMSDLQGQLDYITVENVWHKGTSYQKAVPYDTLSDFLNSSSTDLDSLTEAWMYCWEGIKTSDITNRKGYAKTCYDYITAHSTDPTPTYYYGNRFLSNDERKNNALAVYKMFNGTPVDPNPDEPSKPDDPFVPAEKKKGMPVWMMVRYR